MWAIASEMFDNSDSVEWTGGTGVMAAGPGVNAGCRMPRLIPGACQGHRDRDQDSGEFGQAGLHAEQGCLGARGSSL